MRNLLRASSMFLLIIAAGCIISVYPFYTKDKIVEMNGVDGYWQLNVALGRDVSKKQITPWKISGGTVVSYDSNDKRADFKIIFFKLNDQLFADVESITPQGNEYSNLTVCPMHILLKANFKDDSMELTPFNWNWFNKPDNEQAKKLPHVLCNGDRKARLYIASPQEWEEFIKSNLTNPEIFKGSEFILKKLAPL